MFGGKSRLGGWVGDFFTIVGVLSALVVGLFTILAIVRPDMFPSRDPEEVVVTVVVTPTVDPDRIVASGEVEVTRVVEVEVPVEVTRVVEVEVPGPEVEVEVTRVVEVEVTRIVQVTPQGGGVPTQPPAPTAPANTPPGTILNEGDTWKQDRRELRLINVEYRNEAGDGPKVVAHFQFTNRTTQTIFVACESTNFVVTTNTGLRVLAQGFDGERWCRSQVLPQGSVALGEGYETSVFYFDYFAADVTEFIVTVTDVGGISEAKWRISLG